MSTSATSPVNRVFPPARIPLPRRVVFLLLLILVLAASSASAQTTYTVSGKVTSSLDNHPLQHASVELLSTAGRVVQTVTSDELGQFAFTAVPKDNFVLRGEAPGFLQSSFQQHEAFSAAVVTGAAVPTQGLNLQLKPLGRLSGTVTDELSEPIRNATVHVYRRDPVAGDQRLTTTAQLQTDDLGHYELGRLVPGTYFVSVSATPWYAVHPMPAAAGQASNPFGIVPFVDPALDVAYPLTFYPNATDSAYAAPIQINGVSARADLQLIAVPALTLSIPRSSNQPGIPLPQLRKQVFGQSQYTPTQGQQTQDGYYITGIAPGDYVLAANGKDTPVHLDRNTSTPAPPAEPNLAHVHLTVQNSLTVENSQGALAAGPVVAGLVRVHATTSFETQTVSPRGLADFQAPPGAYYFGFVDGRNKNLYPRQILLDGKPVPDTSLDLQGGDDLHLTLQLVRGAHSVKGIVRKNGLPCPAAMLLLIPAEPHPDLREFFRDESNLDGSFDIAQLPPGPYLLLALPESAWDIAWRSPEFLSRHLPDATPVLIRENSPAEVDLPDPINIQPL